MISWLKKLFENDLPECSICGGHFTTDGLMVNEHTDCYQIRVKQQEKRKRTEFWSKL